MTDAEPEGSPRGQRAIRRRLVRVASELFVEQGYRATTTKEICRQAQTTERTLFRHFGSKAGLFEATVADPFAEFVDRWLDSFTRFPPNLPLDEQIQKFVEALVRFLQNNRVLLRLLIAAEFENEQGLAPVADRISAQFAAGLRTLADEAGTDLMGVRDYNVDDSSVAIAAGVSMALGMVLMDSWVFAHGRRTPSRSKVVREISQMILYGITSRPGST